MTTTPTNWSGEVVFSIDPSAFGARITALKDDTFVLTWENQTDIFGKHLDSQGSFTAGDFLRGISTDAHVLGTPIVTQQDDGSVVVNYGYDTGDVPTDRDVLWAQVGSDYDSVSSMWHTEVSGFDEILLDSVAHGATGDGYAAGGALLFDYTGPGNVTNLVLQFTTTAGDPASNKIFIDSSADRTEQNPAMTALHTGFVAVAYESVDTHTFVRDIRMKVYAPNESQVSGDIIVSATNANAAFPDVVELTDGNFVVAWQQSGGIAFREYMGNGTPLQDNPTIIPDTGGGFVPKITPLNDHGFMVAWTNANGTESDGSPNLDIYLQRFDNEGQAVGDQIHLDEPGDQGLMNMNIATLSDGRVVLTYGTETGDATNQSELAYRIFDPREHAINGTFGNDNIVGRIDGSTITGYSGDDQLTGMGGGDRLIGDEGADILKGQGGQDALGGGSENDRLAGGAGKDILHGDLGADILSGGGGADTFVFSKVADSTVATTGRDIIQDFSHAEHDRIDLKKIDANTHAGGNQQFDFIGGGAFSHHAGELQVTHTGNQTIVNGDVDGDGHADFSIALRGFMQLKEADFVL